MRDLSIGLSPSGWVLLHDTRLSATDNHRLYGDGGDCPPIAIETLTNQMLYAWRDDRGVAKLQDLVECASELRRSLSHVEKAIAAIS